MYYVCLSKLWILIVIMDSNSNWYISEPVSDSEESKFNDCSDSDDKSDISD